MWKSIALIVRGSLPFALVSLFFIVGCGGSDSSSSTPTSSPVPTKTPGASLPVVRASIVDDFSGQVFIIWEASRDIPQNNIIEYHIFRDDQIIGSSPKAVANFTDSQDLSTSLFRYSSIEGPSSLKVQVQDVPPLEFAVRHRYRITVLFRGIDGEYRESAIGQSDDIYVPHHFLGVTVNIENRRLG